MFLEMQDFDVCSNLIKFYPFYPNFAQNLPKLAQIGLNFAHICLKNFLGDAATLPASLTPTPLQTLTINDKLYQKSIFQINFNESKNKSRKITVEIISKSMNFVYILQMQ